MSSRIRAPFLTTLLTVALSLLSASAIAAEELTFPIDGPPFGSSVPVTVALPFNFSTGSAITVSSTARWFEAPPFDFPTQAVAVASCRSCDLPPSSRQPPFLL